MKNDWVGHPTYHCDTFSVSTVDIDGITYFDEQFTDGGVWITEDEFDECWGSILIDIKNKRVFYSSTYNTDKEWEQIIKQWSDNWEELSESQLNEDWYQYYSTYTK